MNVVKLEKTDFELVRKLSKGKYEQTLLQQVFDVMVKARLRYNTKTGITYLRKEKVMEFVNQKDILNYDARFDRYGIIEWEFMGIIWNGCSRKQRGYSII